MAVPRTVLVFHGYSQNAHIFSRRLGALRKECGNNVELVFLDGPHILQPVDLAGTAPQTAQSAATALESLGAAEATGAGGDPTATPRAWYKMNAERTKAFGLGESLLLVRDTLKGRRFDGVFGFSQGAAFAAIIAALLERPHLYPPFLVDGQPLHPPLKFCVAVSGFKVRDPLCEPIFAQPFSTPTLHIIGKTDIIVTEERAHSLVEVSSDSRIEVHDGGHFVPSKGHWRKFLRDYMRDNLADIPSPGLLSSSAPASGAATPIPEGSGGGSASTMKL